MFAALVGSPTAVAGQSFVGLSATGGSLSLNGDAPPDGIFVSRPSYALRAIGGYEVAEGVHLIAQPGVSHRAAGAEFRVPGLGGSNSIGRAELDITYVSLPVGFRIESTNDGIYVTSVISVGYVVDAAYSSVVPGPFDQPTQNPEQDALPNLNAWDFNLGLAIGTQFRIGQPRLVVELQWGQSLVNVTDLDSQPLDWVFPRRFKYSGFTLAAGLEFDLGGRDEGER